MEVSERVGWMGIETRRGRKEMKTMRLMKSE
jgi:hypothetical protein